MATDGIGAGPSLQNPTGLPADFLNRMARAGALAPSGDNLQPWSFSADGDALLVEHDPQRDRSLFNVQALASYIALGAVLENIQIAASAEGYRTAIETFPNGRNENLIARVTFQSGEKPDPLAPYLDRRCTNRRPYQKKPVSPAVLAELDISRQFPQISLHWVREQTKLKTLGKLIARADRVIFENSRIHKHLFSTLRWTREEIESTRDGLPIQSLELGRLGSLAFRSLKNWSVVRFLNRFGFSQAAANHSVLLMQRCSAAGLITAPDLSQLSFLSAGRAFQLLWLRATKENLALQPMTAIIFLPLKSRLGDSEGLTSGQTTMIRNLREELDAFFNLKDAVPAMLFRLGFSAPPSLRTIRRSTT